MFEAFTRGTADVGGIDISYVIGGNGPPVLLLHGYPQCKAMWARVAPLLAAHFTVVCADLRGYGDSGKPRCAPDRSNYAFRAMAGDQVGLMSRLGFARFHAVGHDRGGRTAHRMALDHADRVKTLTVMDIVPTYTMFMKTDQPARAGLLALVFFGAARALSRDLDRAQTPISFTKRRCWAGVPPGGRLRRRDDGGISAGLAQSGDDSRIMLRLPRRRHGGSGARHTRPGSTSAVPRAGALRVEGSDGAPIRSAGRVANAPCRHDGCRLAGRAFFCRSVSAGDGADSCGVPQSTRGRTRDEALAFGIISKPLKLNFPTPAY